MLDKLSPRHVLTWSIRCVCITAPLTLLVFLSWAFRWDLFFGQTRPFAMLMGYLLLLMMSGAAAGVALLSGAFLAIHEAFRAGLETGLAANDTSGDMRAGARHGGDPLLRLVEGGDPPHNHEHGGAK